MGLVEARLIIISDVDDTLKFTSASSKVFTAIRLLNQSEPYVYTKQIFHDLNDNNTEFIYLSSSYKEVFNIETWLKDNQFPVGRYIQRQKESPISQSYFKKTNLRNVLKSMSISNKDNVIFFGDNRYHDISVYLQIIREFSLNADVFIRDHYGRSLKKEYVTELENQNVTYYLSEVDLLNNKIISKKISFITNYEISSAFLNKSILNTNIIKFIRNDLKVYFCSGTPKCNKSRDDEGLAIYLRYYQTHRVRYY